MSTQQTYLQCACPCGCTNQTDHVDLRVAALARHARCTRCAEVTHAAANPPAAAGPKATTRPITDIYVPTDEEKARLAQARASERVAIWDRAWESWQQSLPEKFRAAATEHPKVLKSIELLRKHQNGVASLAIMGKVGAGKCLVGSTLILDPVTGERHTLEDVVLTPGHDQVHTMTTDGRLAVTDIYAKVDTGYKETLTVTLGSGRVLTVTPEHPFLLPDGWRRADQVRVGETVAVAARLGHPSTPVPMSLVDLADVANRIVGDGDAGGLPVELLRAPAEQVAWFLTGVWAACPGNADPLVISFVSRPVADDLQHLLLRFGVQSEVSTDVGGLWAVRVYSECVAALCSVLHVHGALRDLLDARAKAAVTHAGVPLATPELRDAAVSAGVSAPVVGESVQGYFPMASTHPWLMSADLWWDPVVSVEQSGVQRVFDLSIADTHCFLAGDVVVHNTWLAAAYANQAIQQQIFHPGEVLFGSEAQILSGPVNGAFNEFEPALRKLISPRYKMLIIDDVGRGTWLREDMRPKVFSLILDNYWSRNRVVVITTNLDAAALKDYIGEGAMDRLRSMIGNGAGQIIATDLKRREFTEEMIAEARAKIAAVDEG